MIQDLLARKVLNNSILAYASALGTAVLGVLAVWVLKIVVIHRLQRWAEKTETLLDDFVVIGVRRYVIPLLYFAVVDVAVHGLVLNPGVSKAISALSSVLVTIVGILLITQAIHFLIFDIFVKRQPNPDDLANRFRGVMPAVTIAIWIPGLIFLLENLGFQISAVVTGLGIGGVAVALAGAAVLNDLFSYLCITLDQPFRIGDFIVVGEMAGAIERIGIKTTRLRSVNGELLILSNKDLTDARVRNFQQMRRRRVMFRLGLAYGTPTDKLAEAPNVIRSIIESKEKTSFERSHFLQFSESSLDIETVYWVLASDYNLYMDLNQSIQLAIKREFEKRGLEFAYPTRTIYVNHAPAEEKPPAHG